MRPPPLRAMSKCQIVMVLPYLITIHAPNFTALWWLVPLSNRFKCNNVSELIDERAGAARYQLATFFRLLSPPSLGPTPNAKCFQMKIDFDRWVVVTFFQTASHSSQSSPFSMCPVCLQRREQMCRQIRWFGQLHRVLGERVAHCFQYLSQTRRRERPLRMTLCWAKSDYLICGWFLYGSIWMISQNILLNSRLCQLLKEFTKV